MDEREGRAFGMNHTTFRTPTDCRPERRIADGDLTTPRDFAILCRLSPPAHDILKYHLRQVARFRAGRRFPPTNDDHHNHLLGASLGRRSQDRFHERAGFCLSAPALRTATELSQS